MNGLTYRQLHPEKFQKPAKRRLGKIILCSAALGTYLFLSSTFSKQDAGASINYDNLGINRPDLVRMIHDTKVPKELKIRLSDLEELSDNQFSERAAMSLVGAEEWFEHTNEISEGGAVGRWQVTKPAISDLVHLYFDYGSRKDSLHPLLLAVYKVTDHKIGKYLNKMTNKNNFSKNKKELVDLFYKQARKSSKLNDQFGISIFSVNTMRAKNLCAKYNIPFSNDIIYALNNGGFNVVNTAIAKCGKDWLKYGGFEKETRLHIYKARQFHKRFAGKK